LEIQLFKLFHNEHEINELTAELDHKNQTSDRESKKQQKIEEELRDKKKDHGKLVRDMTKLEQQIKDSVCTMHDCFIYIQKSFVVRVYFDVAGFSGLV
jgi:1,4-alpha-glucan branching enzyme